MKELLRKIKYLRYFVKGKKLLDDIHYSEVMKLSEIEVAKRPLRTEIINYLLSTRKEETTYLEIGVRNPAENFNLIEADVKYSVDPGIEFAENPVDFKMTSDEFFRQISKNKLLSSETRFDVIFIDGLHLAEQVDRDISNSLNFVKDDGFIVLHDCNPPTEWHARENYYYFNTPALEYWNGTTWKAFYKWRSKPDIYSCCIDSDWGIGIISKSFNIGENIEIKDPFFEFDTFDKNRKTYLNLIDFNTFQKLLKEELSKK